MSALRQYACVLCSLSVVLASGISDLELSKLSGGIGAADGGECYSRGTRGTPDHCLSEIPLSPGVLSPFETREFGSLG